MPPFVLPSLETLAKSAKWVVGARYRLGSYPWRLLLPRLRRAYSSPELIDWLEAEYGKGRLVQVGDERFPAVILYEPQSPEAPDSILGGLDRTWNPALGHALAGPYWLMRTVTGTHEHRTFTFKGAAFGRSVPFALECGVTRFFHVLRDATSLEWELLEAAYRCDRDGAPISERVPLRNEVAAQAKDVLACGAGRASGVGISTLIAYREGGRTLMNLRRRGRLSISTRRGMFHVFPAGFFQAPFGELDAEHSIEHGVLWEYLEEFHDRKDPVGERRDPTWFYDEGPVRDLRALLRNGLATHSLLGVALDLMNLRPEVLTLLQVLDGDWFHRTRPQFRFSAEVAGSADLAAGDDVMCTVDCAERLDRVFGKLGFNAGSIAPCSAAALVLALKRLQG